ncbi:unnamed protein product [Durusdinium trenchii]|uniref:Serine/threonine-protein phosphatase n=1 Tax=Durusdinium trenchii TaxID=1381693 RepID=A0ABP0KWC4_9DINO
MAEPAGEPTPAQGAQLLLRTAAEACLPALRAQIEATDLLPQQALGALSFCCEVLNRVLVNLDEPSFAKFSRLKVSALRKRLPRRPELAEAVLCSGGFQEAGEYLEWGPQTMEVSDEPLQVGQDLFSTKQHRMTMLLPQSDDLPRCFVEQPASSKEMPVRRPPEEQEEQEVEETSTVASSVPQPSNHGETSQATGTGETSEAAVGACGSERRKSISALDRDIVIREELEIYDPQTKVTTFKSLNGDILRCRRKPRMIASAPSSSCSDSESTVTSTMSERSSLALAPEDTITNWGVLVGKALWCRMKGTTHMTERKIGLLSGAFHHNYGNQTPVVERTRTSLLPANHGKGALRRATAVVNQLKELVKRVGQEETDVLDAEWSMDALSFLFSADYMDSLMILAGGASWTLKDDATVVQACEPCRVFGDIHGQLRDLLIFFHAFGLPTKTGPHFVFNGDFVDRGAHQLEVVGILFALKIMYPQRVWLVRGNHEDRAMNSRYGFEECCKTVLGSFGQKTFDLFQKAFNWLPLACLIEGKILTLHGGIGNGKWTINELAAVKRPLKSEDFQTEKHRWLYNILWSDPIPDDEGPEGSGHVFGVHSSPRTASAVQFGWNITKTFCALNGFDLLVRSHQCQHQGSGCEVMHDQMLMRVFSARDYEDHQNDAAILSISRGSKRGQLVVRMQGVRSLERR